MRKAAVLAVFAIAVGACQSYEDGVRVICQGPTLCAECANATPDMRMGLMARAIEENLGNGKAEDLFGSLAELTPQERGARLEAEAKAAGLADCPLAAEMRQAAAEMGQAAGGR